MSLMKAFERFSSHDDEIPGICPLKGCTTTKVCKGCGYCEQHHYIPVVESVAELVDDVGKDAVLAMLVAKYPEGDAIGNSIIACVKLFADEDGLDTDPMMTYFEVLTLAMNLKI